MSKEQNLVKDQKALHIADVIASAKFEKDLEKAIEEGNEVGYNEYGGYNYYCEVTALREVLKVIKKHLL
jgi:plastocyanin